MLRFFLRNNNNNPIPIKLLFTINQESKLNLTHLRFIHNNHISQKSEAPNSSLTVSYLINSCGLSPQSALSAAKKFNIKTTENPNSVLNLLKSYGFVDAQIAKLITKYPRLLRSNPDTIIKPKLDFYLVVAGDSPADIAVLLSANPHLLLASLEKRVRPNFELLRSILGTNRQVAAAVRRSCRLLQDNLETNFLPNVRTLQAYGVPMPHIAKLAATCPRVMLCSAKQLKAGVESAVKLGFDPSSPMFVRAANVMTSVSPSMWERKVGVFKSLGWSEVCIVTAFIKHPHCMELSEEKIRRGMDFFKKEMHWEPSFVAAHPVLLSLSLEKRVIPRCSVMNVLASKGLASKKLGHTSFLKMTDEKFVDGYVTKYAYQVPEIVKVYEGTMKKSYISEPSHSVSAHPLV